MSRREEDEAIPVSLPWEGNDPWVDPPTFGYPKVTVPGGPGPDAQLPCLGKWALFDTETVTDEHRATCGGCPFQEWCYQTALQNNEWGIWSATSYDERRLLKGKAA